jgi:high affinity sulfate transporter 1
MSGVWQRLPAVQQARSYERAWFGHDLAAGIVLTGLLAPAGMAYAAAAGLPPVNGLYASIIPLFVYAVFGPSRIMVLGPDSSLTPLIAAAVLPALATDPAHAVAIGAMLAILTGVICVGASLARFGFLAELLSAPVRYGYLHGIAITIIVSQAAKICGFSVPGESLFAQLKAFEKGLADGLFNGWAFGVGMLCLVTILVLRSVSRRLPATLIAVIVGIVVSLVFDLESHGVPLVGNLPSGFPSPAWPHLGWDQTRSIFGAALGVAFVAFADTSVLSRTLAVRRHETVNNNHELFALGMSNIGAGLFQGFPISSSSSRTPVAEQSGARTQLTGVVAAIAMIIIAIAVPSIFRNMPQATLAAIVMAAAISLIDIPAMANLYRVRRSEFVLAIAAMSAVAVLGPVTGAVAAVSLSILNFLRLAWKPYTAELVRVDGLKGYHDRARHPEGRTVPGLILYRFGAPLFFANARFFADDLNHRIAERDDEVQCVIITAEPITDVDATAAEMLSELVTDLTSRGIELRFAELKGTVHDRVDRYRLFHGEMPDHTARTTGQAVKAYIQAYDVDWVDWEDRSS